MPTSNILELYSELNERVKEGRRFFSDTFKNEEYVASTPKLTVIDLGAWQGDYSFYCLPFSDNIYSIEPDPVPYKILEDTVEKYALKDKIKTFRLAIHDKNGMVKMNFTHQGGSAVMEDGGETECMTLATFIKINNIEKVDILKIDVENSEYNIFNSTDFHEVADRIKYIIGEFHRGMDGVALPLEKLGFKVRGITGTNLFEAKL